MSWKAVCSIDDASEHGIKCYEVDGVELLVANVGDGFRAYPPVCPHMEEYLEDSGVCSNGVLTCTKHLWQWDMKTGEARGPAEKPLLMYDVKQEKGQVMVYLDKELEYEFDHDEEDED